MVTQPSGKRRPIDNGKKRGHAEINERQHTARSETHAENGSCTSSESAQPQRCHMGPCISSGGLAAQRRLFCRYLSAHCERSRISGWYVRRHHLGRLVSPRRWDRGSIRHGLFFVYWWAAPCYHIAALESRWNAVLLHGRRVMKTHRSAGILHPARATK